MKSSIASYFCAESLAGMREDSLRLLFDSHMPILQSKGITLNIPEDAEAQTAYFGKLSRVTTDIDSGFPPEFYEMLSLVGQLSEQTDLSDILLEARQEVLPEPFVCEGEPTNIELAFLLYRWSPRFVRTHLVGRIAHPKSFVVFKVNGEVPDYEQPSDRDTAAMESIFKAALKDMNRGESCALRIEESAHEVCFIIGHGDLPSMHEFVEDGMPVRRFLRPHDYDMAVFRKDTGDLMVYQKRPSIKLMDVYRTTISSYLFGRTDQFLKNMLNLTPLVRQGEDSIVCADCATFRSAKLVHLRSIRIGARKGNTTHNSEDIFRDFEESPALRQTLLAPQMAPTSAWFKVIAEGREKPVSVKMTLPDKIVVDPPECLPEALYWLNRRSFFAATEQENRQDVA